MTNPMQFTPVSAEEWIKMTPEQRAWQDHTILIAHMNLTQELISIHRQQLQQTQVSYQTSIVEARANARKTSDTIMWLFVYAPMILIAIAAVIWLAATLL